MRLSAVVVAVLCALVLGYFVILIGDAADAYHERVDASIACLQDPASCEARP